MTGDGSSGIYRSLELPALECLIYGNLHALSHDFLFLRTSTFTLCYLLYLHLNGPSERAAAILSKLRAPFSFSARQELKVILFSHFITKRLFLIQHRKLTEPLGLLTTY